MAGRSEKHFIIIVLVVAAVAAVAAWSLLVRPIVVPGDRQVVTVPLHKVAKETPVQQAVSTGRYRDAVKLLEEQAAQSPDDWQIQATLGQCYWEEFRPYSISSQKAVDAYLKAIDLLDKPSSRQHKELLKKLVVVYIRTERLEQARKIYQQLIELSTDQKERAKYRTQIDEIDLDLGTLKPPPDAVYNDAGEVIAPIGPLEMQTNQAFEKGRHTLDPAKEEKWYRLSTQTDASMPQPFANLGMALWRQGKYAEAVESLRKADEVWRQIKERNPQGQPYSKVYPYLMHCLVELGDLEAARQCIPVAAEQVQEDDVVYLALVHLRIAEGKPDEALPIIHEHLSRFGDHADFRHALAMALAAKKQLSLATDVLEELVDELPDDHITYRFAMPRWREQVKQWRGEQVAPEASAP